MSVKAPKEAEWYNSVYNTKRYYRDMGELPYYAHVWYFILSKLPPPPCTVLDVGCGTGQFDRLCADKGYKVMGIDFSQTAIANAKRLTPDGVFECMDFRSNPDLFSRYRGDVVTIIETLEHLHDDIGLVRSIPQDTPVILSVPNVDGPEHVRFFKTAAQVADRYGQFFNDFMVFSRPHAKDKRVVHYVATGRRTLKPPATLRPLV